MVREAWVRWAYHAVIELARLGIEGDLVEAGVFRGGTSCMLARAELFALGAQRAAAAAQRHEDRRLWLFDTFDGLPPPGERDETLLHEAYSAVEAISAAKRTRSSSTCSSSSSPQPPSKRHRANP